MGYPLTLISAILYYSSFPPYTQGYLAFFSLIPFFFALSKTTTIKNAFITGSIWGLSLSLLFSIPLYFALISEYEFSTLYSLILIIISVYIPYGIVYGIYGLSFKYFFDKAGVYSSMFTVSAWLLIDYIMSIAPFFMPWGYAGYTQVHTPFIQVSDLSGIHGVSFIVVIINLLFTGFLIYKKIYSKKLMLIICLLITSSIAYGYLRVHNINRIINHTSGNRISAAIIQGNFGSREKWDSKNTAAVINTYINMSKSVIEKADIIVWPETVLNSSDKNNLEIVSGMSSLLKPYQVFITGATRNDEKNNIYNSIFAAGSTGLNYIYDKKILFPFTETSFAGLSSGQYMDSPAVFNKGKGRPVYKHNEAVLGFTICFESIYPDYVRKIKNLGAGILINVANDSWFGNTYEPYMHLNNNIARAVENRFYVIRSANNGMSAIISPTGEIICSITLNKRETAMSQLTNANIPTLYSKTGDWIIILSFLVIIVFLISQLRIKN